jgi:hypothetical protein
LALQLLFWVQVLHQTVLLIWSGNYSISLHREDKWDWHLQPILSTALIEIKALCQQ